MKAIRHDETKHFQETATKGTYYIVGGTGCLTMKVMCPGCGEETQSHLDMWNGHFGNPVKLNMFNDSGDLEQPILCYHGCKKSYTLTNGEWSEA